MTTAAAKAPGVGGAARRGRASMRDGALLLVIVAMVGGAALAARHAPWTPGSDFGYWLGVAAGTALLDSSSIRCASAGGSRSRGAPRADGSPRT